MIIIKCIVEKDMQFAKRLVIYVEEVFAIFYSAQELLFLSIVIYRISGNETNNKVYTQNEYESTTRIFQVFNLIRLNRTNNNQTLLLPHHCPTHH